MSPSRVHTLNPPNFSRAYLRNTALLGVRRSVNIIRDPFSIFFLRKILALSLCLNSLAIIGRGPLLPPGFPSLWVRSKSDTEIFSSSLEFISLINVRSVSSFFSSGIPCKTIHSLDVY